MVTCTPAAKEAFHNLKRALCSKLVLTAPDFSREFVDQEDASEAGSGAVLAQITEGEKQPVLYLSRKLLPREKNYATVEKECLALKRGPGDPQTLPAGKKVHSSDRSLPVAMDGEEQRDQ